MTVSNIIVPAEPVSSESALVTTTVYADRAATERSDPIQRLLTTPYSTPDLRWLTVLERGLQHEPFLCEAKQGGVTAGVLPLGLVKSSIFGRFLVSLPYVNSAGVVATTQDVACRLIDRAVELADEHDVRYLELRNEQEIAHPALTHKNDTKVLMRLALPPTVEELWAGFKSKLRSQIRAGEKHEFEITWGSEERLNEFYGVFSHNMRDLGTPVYSRNLFAEMLLRFGDQAEICVVRLQGITVAAAFLVHGEYSSEVPSASSLRKYNTTNANMVMYWHLLKRAIERGKQQFDFGRSSQDSNTYRFKKQWGAQPSRSVWQYYLRRGTISDMRPDSAKFRLATRVWQKLPVSLTRWIGPPIVRGIP
jgi:FemAB-related protein (PEP-CTERM system-associated)